MEFQVHDKQEYDLDLDNKEEPRTKQCAVSLGRVLFLLKSKTFSIVTPLIEELLKSTKKQWIKLQDHKVTPEMSLEFELFCLVHSDLVFFICIL